MLEILRDGGLLMLPIAFCSVVAMAICLERGRCDGPVARTALGAISGYIWLAEQQRGVE